MRLKIICVIICLVFVPAAIMAQVLTRDEIRQSEWQMKSEFWKAMQERQSDPTILDQNDYDVKYWELTVDVTDISGQTISGRVRMTSQAVVSGLTSIDYNLHTAMVVDTVLVNGVPAAHTHNSNMLTITLDRAYNTGEQFTTLVTYSGHPPGGGFGSFTWDTHNGQPIISTLSEPESIERRRGIASCTAFTFRSVSRESCAAMLLLRRRFFWPYRFNYDLVRIYPGILEDDLKTAGGYREIPSGIYLDRPGCIFWCIAFFRFPPLDHRVDFRGQEIAKFADGLDLFFRCNL